MSNIQELYPKKPAEPKCSFCGKLKSSCLKLMSNGHDKFICNKCIIKAKEIINANG